LGHKPGSLRVLATQLARSRKLAEMLGVLLVKAARTKRLNVMVETSGRDVAMFKYVDQFFPEDMYRKLVVLMRAR
jgi:hypothetical protein